MKKSDIQGFISFLKNPSPDEQYEISSKSIFLRLIWKSFLVLLAIDIICGIIIVIPLTYFNIFPVLKEFKYTPSNILKVTLIFPIIEELIFRLPLKISKTNVAISFSLLIFLVLNKWCAYNIYLEICFSSVLFLLLIISINEGSSILNGLTHLFTNHFWKFFYFQAIIFGFLHLMNYIIDFRYFYLFPFIIISYIFKGCLFGYLRIKFTYGIYLCIASHIVANSIYCLILS